MRLTWRVTEVWQKALYVVVGYAVTFLFLLGLRTWLLDLRSFPYALILQIVNIAYPVLGVRIFRGYLEPVAPSRAWWRWTGRPTAGFWLASSYLLTALSAIGNFWPHHGLAPDVPSAVLNVLGPVILSFGYLNSSIRLRRQPERWSQKRRAKPSVTAISQ